ncbi:hypothetical protein EMIT079MI2_430019 [Bacillus sp. IT-79MI2]
MNSLRIVTKHCFLVSNFMFNVQLGHIPTDSLYVRAFVFILKGYMDLTIYWNKKNQLIAGFDSVYFHIP